MSVTLVGVTQRYGRVTVVDDVSFSAAQGELFVLLGQSGSGKSSILRLIAGLTQPDEGRILLHGQDVTGLPPQEREAGFVFQNYSIFRHLSVAENVEFGLRIRGVSRKLRAAKRDELLEMVELGGLGGRRPSQLSGGQLQRVALARALAYEPRVLLLDEPFGALDVRIRAQLRRSLRELQRRVGVTTLLVTHDQEEAFELADRIAVIERGRLIETGTPEDLYARPTSGWTASFVGAGSVLLGRVKDGAASLGETSLAISEDAPHEEGGWVRVLVRPEQVALSEQRPQGGAVLGQGEVRERSYTGPLQRVRVRMPPIAGVRQLSPSLPFGEDGIIVEAALPSQAAVPQAPWVTLTAWRTLAQPPSRVVVLGGEDAARDRFVAWLCQSLGAAVDRDDASEAARGAHVTRFYDLAILVTQPGDGEARLDAALERGIEAPLLIVPAGSLPQGRVIACTAVGEPGKATLRVGGWLARRIGERVTLLHAWTHGGEPPPWVTAHLARAVATLRAQGADADLSVRHAPHALRGILDQVEESRPSLVVLGASGVHHRRSQGHLALRVAQHAKVPVVVVPEGSL